ncbi:MAG: Fur family transcriptional regulator [Chloroflexota bacterium]
MSCFITLKRKGLKLTPQRRLILDIIHDTEARFTAEEIIACVQDRMPGVNKSTIYRTLELLEEAGCIYKSEVGDELIYHHVEEGHHHHLVCRKCGKSVDCDEDIFAAVERSLGEKYRFRIDEKHLVMSGLCESCRKKG